MLVVLLRFTSFSRDPIFSSLWRMRSNLRDFWPLMKNFLHRSFDFVPTCRRIILKSLPKDDTAWRKAAFSSSVHSQVPSSISQQVMSGGYRLLAWQRFVASGERESHLNQCINCNPLTFIGFPPKVESSWTRSLVNCSTAHHRLSFNQFLLWINICFTISFFNPIPSR